MTIALPQQNIRMDVSTGIDPVWYDKLKALTDAVNLLGGVSPTVPANRIQASLGIDVSLNAGNLATYFNGPSVAQGTAGTWFVSGTVTLIDTAAAARYNAKLWDGTTIIASGQGGVSTVNLPTTLSLSGFLVSPAGNLRIDVATGSTTGKILFNQSGNSRDSTISAFRIA